MRNIRPGLYVAAFLLLSLIPGYFFQFSGQIIKFTFLDHSLKLSLSSFIFLSLLVFLILLVLWFGSSKALSKAFSVNYREALIQDIFSYLPVAFLALTPLMLSHYLTFADLQTRAGLYFLAVLSAIFYLKAVQFICWNKENPNILKTLAQKILTLSLPKKLVLLFIIALVLYNSGSALISAKGITFSGDEPHYLLITYSLLHDKDFDLANNYAKKDYAKYTIPQATMRSHAIPGAKNDARYSFHSPGVSFILLPFYALGSLFGRKALILILRFGISIFGALLGLQMYLYAREEWQREKLALGLWFLFSLTSPVFFYSFHVYPEVIIALFSFTIFRIFRFSRTLSKSKLLFCGFLLSSFIWFHALKYFFIQIPLSLYCLWTLVKNHEKIRSLIYFLVFPVVITLLYFYFQYDLYGSFSISSISWQKAMDSRQSLNFIKELFFDIPFRYRWETLAGYFLDQRDGLLFYAPIYFFAFLGMMEMIRCKGKDFFLLLFITAPYVLVSAFLTQRTGYAPQARPLVAVCWGLGILMGYFLANNKKKIFSYLFNLAVFFSMLFVWLLLNRPLALYQETTFGTIDRGGELFNLLSNLHFYLPNLLPSYLKTEEWRWLPNFIWPAVLLFFMAAYLLSPGHHLSLKFSHHFLLTSLGLILFFIWLVLYPRVVLLQPVKADLPSGEKIGFYGLSRVALVRGPGQFKLLEDNRFYDFYFTSWRKIQKLKIEFGSPAGDYNLALALFDQKIFEEKTAKEIKAKILSSPPPYRLKNTNLYKISIYLEKTSGVRTGLAPYTFSILPTE